MTRNARAHSLPAIQVFIKALILAEEQGAPEIGVDHLLAALDTAATVSEPLEHATGPLVPVPHREKSLSREAQAAIEAVGVFAVSDLDQLTVDSLRRVLLARHNQSN